MTKDEIENIEEYGRRFGDPDGPVPRLIADYKRLRGALEELTEAAFHMQLSAAEAVASFGEQEHVQNLREDLPPFVKAYEQARAALDGAGGSK